MTTSSDANEQLYQAVLQSDVALARTALQSGATARYAKVLVQEGEKNSLPMLFLACKNKQQELAALLLEHGADPNERTLREWTIPDADRWELACRSSDTCLRAAMPSLELVTLLLENGANPNRRSEEETDYRSTFHALTDAVGQEEVLAVLRRFGAALSRPESFKPELTRNPALTGASQKNKKSKKSSR